MKMNLRKVNNYIKKTSLTPADINEAIIVLDKLLLINNPAVLEKLLPCDFYSVEIIDFGRQVLEKCKEQKFDQFNRVFALSLLCGFRVKPRRILRRQIAQNCM